MVWPEVLNHNFGECSSDAKNTSTKMALFLDEKWNEPYRSTTAKDLKEGKESEKVTTSSQQLIIIDDASDKNSGDSLNQHGVKRQDEWSHCWVS